MVEQLMVRLTQLLCLGLSIAPFGLFSLEPCSGLAWGNMPKVATLYFLKTTSLLNALAGPIRPQKWLQPKKGMGTSRLTIFVTLCLIIRSFCKLLSRGVKSVDKGGACVNIQILHFRVKSGLEMFIISRIDCRMRISPRKVCEA